MNPRVLQLILPGLERFMARPMPTMPKWGSEIRHIVGKMEGQPLRNTPDDMSPELKRMMYQYLGGLLPPKPPWSERVRKSIPYGSPTEPPGFERLVDTLWSDRVPAKRAPLKDILSPRNTSTLEDILIDYVGELRRQ